MKKLVEETNRSSLMQKILAKLSWNHLKDGLLQIKSKGVENTKEEQQEAPRAKIFKPERIQWY